LYPPPIRTTKNAIYKTILDANQSQIHEQLLRLTAPLHQRKGEDMSKTTTSCGLPPMVKDNREKGRDCFGFTGTDKMHHLEIKEKKPLPMPGPAQAAAAMRLMVGHSSKAMVAFPPQTTTARTTSPSISKESQKRDGVQYGLAYRERLDYLKNKPTLAMTQITFGGFDNK
jgi:hypothetical protein